MARIQQEVIVITVSKLQKDAIVGADTAIINDEQLDALTSVAEELLGSGIIVEVSKA
jgi:hypothetical protein